MLLADEMRKCVIFHGFKVRFGAKNSHILADISGYSKFCPKIQNTARNLKETARKPIESGNKQTNKRINQNKNLHL